MESLLNMNAELFAHLTENNYKIWNKFIGSIVEHKTKGIGKLIGIDGKNYFIINFNDSIDDFPSLFRIFDFAKYFNNISIPNKLKDDFDELLSAAHFQDLKIKYNAEHYEDPSPLSDLYRILLKIDEVENNDTNEKLDDEDIQWLEQNQLYPTLSLYFEKKYNKNRWPWDLVLAAKHAKKGDLPERALGLTNIILTPNVNGIESLALSALYNVRGTTFRYTCKFKEAIEMAEKAIQLSLENNLKNNYYPYNTLGGIYYDIGEPEKGDEFFKIAEELGSPKVAKDSQIKQSFSNATDEIKRKNAEYLFKKDPTRYSWVKKYVQASFDF